MAQPKGPRTLFHSPPTAHSSGWKLVVTQQRLTSYRQAKASPSPPLPRAGQGSGEGRGVASQKRCTPACARSVFPRDLGLGPSLVAGDSGLVAEPQSIRGWRLHLPEE